MIKGKRYSQSFSISFSNRRRRIRHKTPKIVQKDTKENAPSRVNKTHNNKLVNNVIIE
jgi:hypothetical protein